MQVLNQYWAEREGFEPSIPCGIPPFQGGALGHYATSPNVVHYTSLTDFRHSSPELLTHSNDYDIVSLQYVTEPYSKIKSARSHFNDNQ